MTICHNEPMEFTCQHLEGGYQLEKRIFSPVVRCTHIARVEIDEAELGIRYLACETHAMNIREAIQNGATGWTIVEL